MIKTNRFKHVGVITLANKERKNAINQQMMEQITATLNEWQQDDRVKCVMFTGEGDAFCSGGDLKEFHSLTVEETKKMLQRMNETLTYVYEYPKPTVAALNGITIGGGCEIAASCDFRLAHEDVKFGFIQIRLGITTGWGGATRLFSRISASTALHMLLSGRMFTATEGLDAGFIDQLFPVDSFSSAVLKWSTELTEHPLPAIMAYKKAWLDYHNPQLSMREKMIREVERGAELWKTKEHEEAINHFLKRSSS